MPGLVWGNLVLRPGGNDSTDAERYRQVFPDPAAGLNLKRLCARLFDLARMARYATVGIAATATYLAVFNLVAAPLGPGRPFTGHLAGLCLSILVSYTGHHAYTFRRSGLHGRYFARFVVITAALSVLSSAAAFACDRTGYSAAAISLLVTMVYPAGSYLLNTLWTFAEQQRSPA